MQRAVMLPGSNCQPRPGWDENRVAVKKDISRAWCQQMKTGNLDRVRKRTDSETTLGYGVSLVHSGERIVKRWTRI